MHVLGILGFILRQEESLGKFKLLEIKAKFKVLGRWGGGGIAGVDGGLRLSHLS